MALLFTDVLMPGRFDGLALAHEARRRWPEMPIVVVSGRVTPNTTELPEGVRFLSKPYYTHTLARVIREMGVCTSTN